MEEEQRLRGRLSRRRPPARGGCRPWFLMEGNKSEPWAALLRSTVSGDEDLSPNSQPLPPLPTFASQESLPDPEPTVPPEVFTVGSKTFSWTPFPPALGGSGNAYQLFHGPRGSLGSPIPSLKRCPAPDSCQTPILQECMSVQSTPVLLSCPLCQKAFDPMLAQLDVDSHIAQCLAESTEDMVCYTWFCYCNVSREPESILSCFDQVFCHSRENPTQAETQCCKLHAYLHNYCVEVLTPSDDDVEMEPLGGGRL